MRGQGTGGDSRGGEGRGKEGKGGEVRGQLGMTMHPKKQTRSKRH